MDNVKVWDEDEKKVLKIGILILISFGELFGINCEDVKVFNKLLPSVIEILELLNIVSEGTSNWITAFNIQVPFGTVIVNKLFDVNDKYYDINAQIYDLIPNKFKNLKLSYDIFIKHLLNDKKNDGTNICFIVLDDIGKISFQFRQLDVINDKLKEIFLQFFQN